MSRKFQLSPRAARVLAVDMDLTFFFFLAFLKYRQAKHLAHLIVTLPELDQLRLADVKLSPVLQRYAVDDKVRVDVAAVGMGTDQHLASREILGQFHCRGVRRDRVDIGALREGMHHVEEQRAAVLVIEELGAEKIIIGSPHALTRACPCPVVFVLPHRVPMTAAMTPFG